MAEEFNTDDMLSTFVHESTKQLKKLNGIIEKKQGTDGFDDVDINDIFRIMHTIKGISSVMMYENIANATHRFEDVFYYLRESHAGDVPHKTLVEMVRAVSDFISGELAKIEKGDEPDGDESRIVNDLQQFYNELKAAVNNHARMAEEDKNEDPVQFYITSRAEEDTCFYRIVIHYKQDVAMSNIMAYSVAYALKRIAVDIFYTPENILSDDNSAEQILADGFYILLQTRASKEEIMELIDSPDSEKVDFEEITATEYRSRLAELGREEELIVIMSEDYERENEQNPIVPGDYIVRHKDTGKRGTLVKNWYKQQTGINVDDEKMDTLMELVGRLSVAEEAVVQNSDLKVPDLELTNFKNASAQLSKIIIELRETVMSMRKMPFTELFHKMKKIAMDVSEELDKNITFERIGGDVEVDKKIIQHIYEPLMHLVKNAVDYGIEQDTLDRVLQGKPPQGKIVLEAKKDDGKVYVSVYDDGVGMEKEMIYEHSKHGAGMDVVMKNIQPIGGTLEIDSTRGKGTKMTLVIPLSPVTVKRTQI
ncbi:MAG: ATP-binding protein [Clostridium sp.]|nr:ATP-binding protein [Clostridium sp.]MCM1399631.1 ATP-binding protein [Clostridium sp.]MCM1460491.1 ATP-binding protein [Bacteroides sp.]